MSCRGQLVTLGAALCTPCASFAQSAAVAETAAQGQPSMEDAAPAQAPGDENEFDALFKAPVSRQPASAEAALTPAWSFGGALRSESAVWSSDAHDARLAKQRLALDLNLAYRADLRVNRAHGSLQLVAHGHGEYDFAYLQSSGDFDAPLREAYQWQVIAREAYLNLQLGWFELTVGRRIVTWGQGEVLGSLNVLNPRDLREPMAANLDDLWLGVLMTQVGLSWGRQRLTLLAIHEPYFGLLPPPLAPLSPLRDLLLEQPNVGGALAEKDVRYRHVPPHDLRDLEATQYHGRWSFSGRGVDLALQAGSLLDPLGVPSLPAPAAYARPALDLIVFHPRYTLLGHAGAATLGPFLLRWELSAELGRPTTLRRINTPFLELVAVRRTQLNGLLGLTYFGKGSTTAGLELQKSVLIDSPNRNADGFQTLWAVESPQIAARADYRFLRDHGRLSALVLAIGIPDFVALAARAELGFLVVDDLLLSAGYMYYRSSERFNVFYGFTDNGRFLATLRWDFSVQ